MWQGPQRPTVESVTSPVRKIEIELDRIYAINRIVFLKSSSVLLILSLDHRPKATDDFLQTPGYLA